jgi:hypothetical protein
MKRKTTFVAEFDADDLHEGSVSPEKVVRFARSSD